MLVDKKEYGMPKVPPIFKQGTEESVVLCTILAPEAE
jgi:hypothetical protein